MHSRDPSFVITPLFAVYIVNHYLVIHTIVEYVKSYWNNCAWLPLISTMSYVHGKALGHEEIALCSRTDPQISERFLVHPRTLAGRFSVLLWYSFVTACGWLGLWRHSWRRQWLWWVQYAGLEWDLYTEFRFNSRVIILNFIWCFPCYKREKMGPLHMFWLEVLRVLSCDIPALAYSLSRVFDESTNLCASDIHDALAPFLNSWQHTLRDTWIIISMSYVLVSIWLYP